MIILDGKRMGERAELHAQLKEKLRLPEYYGGNLDALNDCLGERRERELRRKQRLEQQAVQDELDGQGKDLY